MCKLLEKDQKSSTEVAIFGKSSFLGSSQSDSPLRSVDRPPQTLQVFTRTTTSVIRRTGPQNQSSTCIDCGPEYSLTGQLIQVPGQDIIHRWHILLRTQIATSGPRTQMSSIRLQTQVSSTRPQPHPELCQIPRTGPCPYTDLGRRRLHPDLGPRLPWLDLGPPHPRKNSDPTRRSGSDGTIKLIIQKTPKNNKNNKKVSWTKSYTGNPCLHPPNSK